MKAISNKLPPCAVERWQMRREVALMMKLLHTKYDQCIPFQQACRNSGDSPLFKTMTALFWGVEHQREQAKYRTMYSYKGQNTVSWMIMFIWDKKKSSKKTDSG